MHSRFGTAALAAAFVAISAAAFAQSGGVTVLRGIEPAPAGANAGPTDVGNGGNTNANASNTNNGNGIAGNSAFDQSGDVNALTTGSSNAGGVIPNPPPGGGRGR